MDEATRRRLTWEIRSSFGVKVQGGIRSDLEAIDLAIDLDLWNFTVQPEMASLIRTGIVCGTCADEGIRECNCYATLEAG